MDSFAPLINQSSPENFFEKNKKLLILLATGLIFTFLISFTYLTFHKSSFSNKNYKTYSLFSFDPKKIYKIPAGSKLTGKSLPNSQLEVIITPGADKKDLTVDSSGNWVYQIPFQIAPNSYHLSVILKDSQGQLLDIKTFNINIIKAQAQLNFSVGKLLSVRPVLAQNTTPSPTPLPAGRCNTTQDCQSGQTCQPGECTFPAFCVQGSQFNIQLCQDWSRSNACLGSCINTSTPSSPSVSPSPSPSASPASPPTPPATFTQTQDYQQWLRFMHAFGLYPVEDKGEVMILSKDQFFAKFCQSSSPTSTASVSPPPACSETLPSEQDLRNRILADKFLISGLKAKLETNNLDVLGSMALYLPLLNEDLPHPQTTQIGGTIAATPTPSPTPQKPLATADQFNRLLTETITSLINQQAFNPTQEDPIKSLYKNSNPLFVTRQLINFLNLLPPNFDLSNASSFNNLSPQIQDNLRNATLGLILLEGLTVGPPDLKLAINSSHDLDTTKMIGDIKTLQQVIKNSPTALAAGSEVAKTWLTTFSSAQLPSPSPSGNATPNAKIKITSVVPETTPATSPTPANKCGQIIPNTNEDVSKCNATSGCKYIYCPSSHSVCAPADTQTRPLQNSDFPGLPLAPSYPGGTNDAVCSGSGSIPQGGSSSPPTSSVPTTNTTPTPSSSTPPTSSTNPTNPSGSSSPQSPTSSNQPAASSQPTASATSCPQGYTNPYLKNSNGVCYSFNTGCGQSDPECLTTQQTPAQPPTGGGPNNPNKTCEYDNNNQIINSPCVPRFLPTFSPPPETPSSDATVASVQPGQQLAVSAVSYPPQLTFSAALGPNEAALAPPNSFVKSASAQTFGSQPQIQILEGGSNCKGTCHLILPNNLSPGIYRLTVYLFQEQAGQRVLSASSTLDPTRALATNSVLLNVGNFANSTVINLRRLTATCDPKDKNCTNATGLYCDPTHLKTALGCLAFEPKELISAVMRLAVGVGGGIALLLMIMGAFKMITSSGNADQLKSGREQFTSAIIGLLFVIFSVLLLQVIGVDILNLPGFGK